MNEVEGDLGDDPFGADDAEEAVGEKKDNVETWHAVSTCALSAPRPDFRDTSCAEPGAVGRQEEVYDCAAVVQRDGSKKTVFANVVDICKRMHRQPTTSFNTSFRSWEQWGSVDGSQRLVIKGRFQPKQIENVLRRYIGKCPPEVVSVPLSLILRLTVEYVTCKTCKSPQTILTKENRIYFMTCESCGSTRSVTTIKTGFQAQTGKRSKMRAQT
ncbi:hypothetical protein L7F22_014450 [Adiantum nelumboides]|nr:hypothetical protein [Adiantum nelumboides]